MGAIPTSGPDPMHASVEHAWLPKLRRTGHLPRNGTRRQEPAQRHHARMRRPRSVSRFSAGTSHADHRNALCGFALAPVLEAQAGALGLVFRHPGRRPAWRRPGPGCRVRHARACRIDRWGANAYPAEISLPHRMDRDRLRLGMPGTATVFAENAGVIGLLMLILVWVSSYTAYLKRGSAGVMLDPEEIASRLPTWWSCVRAASRCSAIGITASHAHRERSAVGVTRGSRVEDSIWCPRQS